MLIKPDGIVMEFQQPANSLYYLDTIGQQHQQGHVMMNTGADHHSNYTNADYLCALAVRKLQVKIGDPTTQEIIMTVISNTQPNCPQPEWTLWVLSPPPNWVSTYTKPIPWSVLSGTISKRT